MSGSRARGDIRQIGLIFRIPSRAQKLKRGAHAEHHAPHVPRVAANLKLRRTERAHAEWAYFVFLPFISVGASIFAVPPAGSAGTSASPPDRTNSRPEHHAITRTGSRVGRSAAKRSRMGRGGGGGGVALLSGPFRAAN
ncbi:hypothetical protein T492DRAFT_837715 [Pavlovales sp. CCMP2436]|nr:hypothetical protein T492DRAFT_837715 [Pavlovales sp. CCMP2436]